VKFTNSKVFDRVEEFNEKLKSKDLKNTETGSERESENEEDL